MTLPPLSIASLIRPLRCVGALLAIALLLPPSEAFAKGDRAWLAVPLNNNWNDSGNWSGGNVPDTVDEGAAFATSTILNPTFNANTTFGPDTQGFGIYFQPGADPFVIEINGYTVQVQEGIKNESSVTQTIRNGGANGVLNLLNGSIVGEVTIINSGALTTTQFAGNIQGGEVRLVNAHPTATFDFSGLTVPGTTVGSIEGHGFIVLGATALTVGGNDFNTVFSGVISDGPQAPTGGSLIKVGQGSLTLTGINTYSGETTVRSGALFVDGSIASPKTVVEAGAWLGGSGVIGGRVFNHGTISPGTSPGTLTFNGGYQQFSDGALRIEIVSKDVFDRLLIGGAASLDGTLQVVGLGGFKPKRGDTFRFLTAAGGISGGFDEIVQENFNGLLRFAVEQDGNSLLLTAEVASFVDTLPGLSGNQIAVAESLDKAVREGASDKLIDFLSTREFTDLYDDLDRIAPEELVAMFETAISLATVQAINTQRRTDDLRSGASGFSAAGLAMQGTGPGYSGGLWGAAGPSGKESKDLKTVVEEAKRWGVFLTGVGEWVDVGGDGNARGYDITTGGFTLGVDYKVTPHFAIGLSAGYAGTSAELTDDGRVWTNGGKLGLYATYFTGGFYVDTAVSGGYNSFDTKRSALQGAARGSTDGGELNVLFGTGYDWQIGALKIGPTATFQYTYVGLDGFSEHGSLAPLTFGDQHAESLRSAFGLKASYDWRIRGVIVRPELRAAWQHEYGDESYDLSASFANNDGNQFSVSGPKLGRDSVLLGAGFAVQFNERTAMYLYYDGEVGRERYESHSVSGGIRVAF